jgi:pantoate--beta-alanine ligase
MSIVASRNAAVPCRIVVMSHNVMAAKRQPLLIARCAEVHRAVADARAEGKSIGVVPTMGALHEGHLSLVRASRGECDMTVVTIFVNPTQFGPHEDFSRYPRTLDKDSAALGECGADLVFAPANDEMYPAGFSSYVEPPKVAEPLEGRCRPGHFRGVATVVLKLFNVIPADVAFFGQKDYQQSLVIRRMVEDLNVPTEIRVCPIVREPGGLAMSSRNVHLNNDERQQALAISRSLHLAAELVRQGELDAAVIKAKMLQTLADAGITRVDYVALADPETLEDVSRVDLPRMALVAAHVGNTRLIDNHRLEHCVG